MEENRKYNITLEIILLVIGLVDNSAGSPNTKISLEDVLYSENSKYFITIEDAAHKFRVSPIDIMTWIHGDILEGYRLPTGQFVVPTYAKPKENMFSVIS